LFVVEQVNPIDALHWLLLAQEIEYSFCGTLNLYLKESKTNEMMSNMFNSNDLTTSSRWSIPVVVIWAPFDKMSDKIELGILLSSELRNLQANIRSTAQKEIVLALGWVRTTSVHCLLDHLKFFNFN